jgi:hypothetical protein
MHQSDDTASVDYPHGRGYGHDYMRGGEVLGGYGYAEREEYEKRRGEAPDGKRYGKDGGGGSERS